MTAVAENTQGVWLEHRGGQLFPHLTKVDMLWSFDPAQTTTVDEYVGGGAWLCVFNDEWWVKCDCGTTYLSHGRSCGQQVSHD